MVVARLAVGRRRDVRSVARLGASSPRPRPARVPGLSVVSRTDPVRREVVVGASCTVIRIESVDPVGPAPCGRRALRPPSRVTAGRTRSSVPPGERASHGVARLPRTSPRWWRYPFESSGFRAFSGDDGNAAPAPLEDPAVGPRWTVHSHALALCTPVRTAVRVDSPVRVVSPLSPRPLGWAGGDHSCSRLRRSLIEEALLPPHPRRRSGLAGCRPGGAVPRCRRRWRRRRRWRCARSRRPSRRGGPTPPAR